MKGYSMFSRKNDKLYQDCVGKIEVIFAILIVLTIAYMIIGSIVFPKENDRYFSRVELSSTEYEDLLYRGDFEWVHNDGSRESISVPGDYDVPVNEVMTIETVIPEDIDTDMIEIRSSMQTVRMYVDGQLRTEYDTSASRPFGSQVTSRYLFCPVSDSDIGKTLRIEISTNTEMYSGYINEIFACEKYEFWICMITSFGMRSVFGIVLIIVGIFTIILSMCLRYAFKSHNSLEYLGWCVVATGAWLVCESKIKQVLLSNSSVMNNISYLVIMMAPIPLLLYLNSVQKRRYQKVYVAVMIAAVINIVVTNALQIADIVNYTDSLPASHVILIAAIAIALVTFILDIRNGSIRHYMPICIGMTIVFVSVIIELILAYVITTLSGLFLMIGGIALILAGLFMTISEIRENEANKQNQRIAEQKKQSEAMLMQLIRTLSNTIEAKDEYLRGHSSRVAEYTVAIAREMGMDEEKISKLWYAATLHDLGKIGVPDTILNKPSRLSEAEFGIIKTHTTLGADILANVEIVSYTADIAMHHHERYDGKGYPEGLKGEDISLDARIVAVADAFDAMNSNRIYRRALTKEVIRSDIEKNKGKQFDPEVATVFLKLYDEGKIDEIEAGAESMVAREKVIGIDLPNEKEVEKVLSMVSETMMSNKSDEDSDSLTGLDTRKRGEERIAMLMKEKRGALIFCDMDNLKTINDRYGHKEGDIVLQILGSILKEMSGEGEACRIGGDEFLLFLSGADEDETVSVVKKIMEEFYSAARVKTETSSATISMGICPTNQLCDYADVFNKADKALYYIKQRGKDGYYIYKEDKISELEKSSVDINVLKKSIMSAGKYEGALDIGYREFAKLYEYISKVCKRYEHSCNIVLITLDTKQDARVYIDDTEFAMSCMERAINSTIRNVDICTRYTSVQFLVILLEAGDNNVDMIMSRILSNFHKMYNDSNASFEIRYDVSKINDDEEV